MRSFVNFLVAISATYGFACDTAHQYIRRDAVSNAPAPSPAIGGFSEIFTETIAALPAPPTPIAGFFNTTLFPKQQQQNVTHFLRQASELSTDWRIHQFFQDQCITQQVFPKLFTQPAGFVTPFSPFDNFYFVGQAFVSSWAYDTGDGLVVIDSLDSSDEIKAIMLPALEKFGFSGNDIKHVIVTHEHLDHYGGAKYLKETYNSTIYASEVAWQEMATYTYPPNSTSIPPSKDKTLVDGQILQVGNVSFEIVLTPGHTPGTLSLIFPLTDKNGTKHHRAGLNGGTGIPQSATDRTAKVLSHYRLAAIAYERGVDTLISNHQVADHALFNSDLLAHASSDIHNPFVIGRGNYYNYLRILGLCTKVYAARQGMDLWA
ncbi:Beta-lactamase domain protein [Penicillium waksmanii]|uniref:Beta-lactamase domain protein n=1 Tax=Penicillium waksmanii TaxID=69791 RepID=UPI002548E017|nr:Beta-lactamase domain protein [Penicillium waksmanii]KAJ5995547.1 Beta-lactamase domain protein [Penicillium waksmanii]